MNPSKKVPSIDNQARSLGIAGRTSRQTFLFLVAFAAACSDPLSRAGLDATVAADSSTDGSAAEDSTDGRIDAGADATVDAPQDAAADVQGDMQDAKVDTPDAGALRVVSLAAGGEHVCALLSDGRVKCWGSASQGELGLGDTNKRGDASGEMGASLPSVSLGTGRKAVAIATGNYFTCAILDNGSVKCWGANDFGQLGLGDSSPRGSKPSDMGDALPAVNLGTGRTAKAIGAGLKHVCALLDDDSVKCWGDNWYFQLGLGAFDPKRGTSSGDMGDYLPPVALGTGRTVKSLAVGGAAQCALLDNATTKCWGWNAIGQLGLGDTTIRGESSSTMGNALAALDLGKGRTAKMHAVSSRSACALLDNGTIKCWGEGLHGELGAGLPSTTRFGDNPGEMGDALVAVNLGTGRTATSISAGPMGSSICAALDNGSLKCWGEHYPLGIGDSNDRGDATGEMGDAMPAMSLGLGRTTKMVTHGISFMCALLDNDRVKCWGWNGSGQLGLGDVSDRTEPSQMGDALPYVDLF